MFKKPDEQYLKRQISNNQVVLFLGSGFSLDSKNIIDNNFPSGWVLGELMWKFLKYEGEYDDTPLSQMYEAFLSAGIKKNLKKEFLEKHLLSGEIPDFYDSVTIPFWFKIYTINIDDILSKTFRKNNKGIEELRFPFDQYSERDQSLSTTQITYLHGKLPCEPDEVVFSTQQYAKAQLSHQPLYSQFVYDYATLPVIFIGTQLDEPIFERYIVARENRYGFKELRPKSFLITPTLSPVKAENFKNNYNVHYISGKTEDFLGWINSIKTELPEKKEVLKRTFPNLLNIMEYADIAEVSKKSIVQFSKSFNRVPKEFTQIKERSGFLLGTSPRWNDVVRELDIPRSITLDIYNEINEIFDNKDVVNKTHLINIVGYAGSGKSTILKRLGLMLSQNSRTAFLTYSEYLPKTKDIVNILNGIEEQVVLLFDNPRNILNQLSSIINSFNVELENPPIIILALRTNFVNRIDQFISNDTVKRIDFSIPDLSDTEIKYLIEKLDKHNLLGILKGKNTNQRFNEFKYRSHRQILIAMKEATNGKSFGDIIEDEFNSITPTEAKTLIVCIALNTELGFSNSKQDLVGFSKVSHIESLNYLNSVLQGTIIWLNERKFMLRHKILADYILRYSSSTLILKDAYIRVLSVLAPELNEFNRESRKFNLYKSLINHKVLYRRFKNNIEHAREVYDSISDFFNKDAHFWLQYGSLEIEGKGGDLQLAENYLTQAESLSPNSYYIQNAVCHLLYRQSIVTATYEGSIEFKIKADELSQDLILNIGKEEPYIYHICCSGRYKYISKWITDRNSKKDELDNLKKTIRTALTLHPLNKKLLIASEAIQRAYLQLGVAEYLIDPEIPEY